MSSTTTVAAPAARHTGLVVPSLVALAALVAFIGLGTWQIERKAWKEALIATLDRLLTPNTPYWRVALACVEGLAALGDRRAVPTLTAAAAHPRLAAAAAAALARLGN